MTFFVSRRRHVPSLYVTPWLGVGYVFGLDDVVLAGESFTMSPLAVFPAVHVGYRLD